MAARFDSSSFESYGAVEAAGVDITVPDANLLFSGDFSRAGSDLILTGSDGAKFVVTSYFETDSPPALLSPEGAMLMGDAVTALAGPQYPGQYAQAGGGPQGAEAIGQVQTLSGGATVIRTDGTTQTLNEGDPVFQGDVVQTGPGAKLGISFVDGTVFSLSANARMVLNSLIYDPGGSNNSMLFSLVEGTFVFATGQIAPTGDMKINTPVATMGIRGTAPTVSIDSVTGQVNFSIVPDPVSGNVGTYTLYSLTTGEAIGTINSTGSTWSLTSADGSVTEIPKTEDDLLNDQSAINEITSVFNSSNSSGNQQQQGDPNDITNAIPNTGPPDSSGLNTGPGNNGPDGNTPPPDNTPPPPPEGDPAPNEGDPQGNNNTNNNTAPGDTGGTGGAAGPNIINGDEFDNILTGTPGVDLINGGLGKDVINALGGDDIITISPGGGPDVVNAGEGNDTLIVSEGSGWVFDGGPGIDTLRIEGALNIDTSNFNAEAENIEIIDLNKSADNVFSASAEDFITPGTNNTIQFRGGAGDTLNIKPELYDEQTGELIEGTWQQVQEVRIIDGLTFDVYQFTDGVTVFGTAEVERGIQIVSGNQVIGTGNGETLTGSPGNDVLTGLGGDDIIIGDPVQTTNGQGVIPSTGQQLNISMTMLDTSNAGTIDISGFVSRTAIEQPNFNIAFVVDVSGSTFGATLAAEIEGIEALYNSIVVDAGLTNANLALIPFSSTAQTSFSGPASQDDNAIQGPDFLEALQGLRAGGGTNFEAALQQTITFFNAAAAGASFVFFLSDGFGFGAIADEVATLTDPGGINATIKAFGIGGGASVAQLDLLDDGIANDSADVILDPSELSAGLIGSDVTQAEIARVEFLLDGQVVGTIQSQNLIETPFGLRYDFALSGLDPAQADQVTVRVIASDEDSTSVSTTQTLESNDGASGGDTIIGGDGNDLLTGGSGPDTFVLNSLGNGVDTITDFDAQQDVLDLSALLNGVFVAANGDKFEDYVRAVPDSETGETKVQVDIDGPGQAAGFTDVAILQGIGSGVNIAVTIGDHDDTATTAPVVA